MAMRSPRLPALAARLPAACVVAIATYYAVWGGEYSAFDLRSLRARERTATEHLALTRATVDSLRAVASALESDPATIEAVARERFGMIREGELLYRFVPVAPDPAPTEPRLTARGP